MSKVTSDFFIIIVQVTHRDWIRGLAMVKVPSAKPDYEPG